MLMRMMRTDLSREDRTLYTQILQSLVSFLLLLSYYGYMVDHSNEIVQSLRMLVVMSITLKVLSRESLALRPGVLSPHSGPPVHIPHGISITNSRTFLRGYYREKPWSVVY